MNQPGKRLLIVDDDADMRLSLKLALEMAGYTAELAADGREALAIQQQRPADVLITDIFMPERDGLETITAFRQEFPRTRIIAMSGGGVRVGGTIYLDTAGAAGADATLRKTFDPKTLLGVLQSME